MKTMHRIPIFCLSLLLLFSFMFSSCKKEEPPTVTFIYTKVEEELDYMKAGISKWREFFGDDETITLNEGWNPEYPYTRVIPWSEDSPNEPNSTVVVEDVEYYSYVEVYKTVYDYLESGSTEEMQFLIRPRKRKDLLAYRDHYRTWPWRDKLLNQWREDYVPEGELIEKVGFILWTGTAEELLALGDCGTSILVCFQSDFQSIFGMSIEKAQEMIDAGELDMWCCPVESSPLHDKTGAEIAEYLAKQEQE